MKTTHLISGLYEKTWFSIVEIQEKKYRLRTAVFWNQGWYPTSGAQGAFFKQELFWSSTGSRQAILQPYKTLEDLQAFPFSIKIFKTIKFPQRVTLVLNYTQQSFLNSLIINTLGATHIKRQEYIPKELRPKSILDQFQNDNLRVKNWLKKELQ